MSNPYLARRRSEYDALRQSIEGIQNRAAQENRDLTPEELTSVRSQGEQAQTLAAEITDLTEIQNRHAAVASLAAEVAQDAPAQAEETRTVRVGTTTTRDRDPGHYRKDGGRSFFGDLFAARSLQDETAQRRLIEHNRALDMAGEGPGVIPPVWMAEEFQELARQQRKVANAVRNIALSSAAPISMPKQTAGTDDVVADQANENDPTSFTDAWDSGVDTVAPRATAGGQKLSRQMLDSGNPAVDAMIYDDLVASYNLKVEAKVVAAMVASAGTAVKTYATNAAWTTSLSPSDTNYVGDALVDAALAVRTSRKLPANILVSAVARYGSLLKIKDSTGRPLIPAASGGPVNIIGRGDVATDGYLDTAALSILATDGVPATFPESVLVARAQDVILFESPTLRFKYEEPDGPETIRLGIWAYTATYVKYAGASVKRIAITAAS
ncbi:hypothetical protein [Pseudonocardia sp. NPDC049154]|uniref:hypothetical protein n=1 Tax=Pseudonocardia sp. NPDC049154 TaxID=3155501 RepID=UPI0033F4B574